MPLHAACGILVPWPRIELAPPSLEGFFPGGSDGKESVCNAGDGSVSALGRSSGEGKGYPLYPMNRGAWRATSLWDRKELDKTEWLMFSLSLFPALEVQSLNHWTCREVPVFFFKLNKLLVTRRERERREGQIRSMRITYTNYWT